MNISERILQEKIIAVLVLQKEEELRPCIDALLQGGIRAIELALRSPYALTALRCIAQEYPEILLGTGTVLNPEQVQQIRQDAAFAVAPGLNRRILETARDVGLPFFPGISTASEIEVALEYDLRLLKFFPAEPLGGLAYLKSMNGPYQHLGIRYIPLGGVDSGNLAAYLQEPIIGAVGGSWIAPKSLIEAKDWQKIRSNATEAIAIWENL